MSLLSTLACHIYAAMNYSCESSLVSQGRSGTTIENMFSSFFPIPFSADGSATRPRQINRCSRIALKFISSLFTSTNAPLYAVLFNIWINRVVACSRGRISQTAVCFFRFLVLTFYDTIIFMIQFIHRHPCGKIQRPPEAIGNRNFSLSLKRGDISYC